MRGHGDTQDATKMEARDAENTKHSMWIGSLTVQVEGLHCRHLGMKIMAALSSV